MHYHRSVTRFTTTLLTAALCTGGALALSTSAASAAQPTKTQAKSGTVAEKVKPPPKCGGWEVMSKTWVATTAGWTANSSTVLQPKLGPGGVGILTIDKNAWLATANAWLAVDRGFEPVRAAWVVRNKRWVAENEKPKPNFKTVPGSGAVKKYERRVAKATHHANKKARKANKKLFKGHLKQWKKNNSQFKELKATWTSPNTLPTAAQATELTWKAANRGWTSHDAATAVDTATNAAASNRWIAQEAGWAKIDGFKGKLNNKWRKNNLRWSNHAKHWKVENRIRPKKTKKWVVRTTQWTTVAKHHDQRLGTWTQAAKSRLLVRTQWKKNNSRTAKLGMQWEARANEWQKRSGPKWVIQPSSFHGVVSNTFDTTRNIWRTTNRIWTTSGQGSCDAPAKGSTTTGSTTTVSVQQTPPTQGVNPLPPCPHWRCGLWQTQQRDGR